MKYFTIAVLYILSLAAVKSAAFSVGSSSSSSSMSSSFGGSVLITGKNSVASPNGRSNIDMKKGKENVPPAMRSQYRRQKEMSKMREQMIQAQKPGPDGLPVFNLFVRTKRANVSFYEILI
jgi:hypothetical protein